MGQLFKGLAIIGFTIVGGYAFFSYGYNKYTAGYMKGCETVINAYEAKEKLNSEK